MISLNNITIEFNAKPLFNDVSFVINPRDKIALVGKNGAGKTTLLKVIKGLQPVTTGNVAVPDDVTIGYLPQTMILNDNRTVKEEVRQAFSGIDALKDKIAKVNQQLTSRTDYESPEYLALIDRLTDLNERLNMSEATNMEAEIEKTLLGLGFKRSDFDRDTGEFSGGWRMRIELTKILLQQPDLLLLDEPTNHLDIESIQWLENFLSTRAKAVLLISHDRAFLDNVTKRTIEINCGKIYDYSVNYSKFVELRKERVEQQMRAYQNQQKAIADTEAFIERFRYKATKAVQVQSRMKQLEKVERIEVDEVDTSRLKLKFAPAQRSGDFPLIVEDAAKSYGDHLVFSGVNLTLRRGDKVAFVGKNGEGKSTLVKCIMNEIGYDGTVKTGHNVQTGYFAQNQASLLDGDLTVFDTIDRVAVGDIRLKIRDLLGAFMFGGPESEKKVKVLSGGERTRLAMLKLLLEPVNFLILDEPTNHLDMVTKDVLKQAVKEFTGTVIIVSHDREFLDGLVDRVYEFGDGKVRECIGGIYEYLEKKNMQENTPVTSPAPTPQSAKEKPDRKITPKPAESTPRLTYAEQRERDKAIKRALKNVKEREEAVARAENNVKEIETKIAAGDTQPDLYNQHAAATKELENLMSEWELAVMQADELNEKYGIKD